MPKWVFIWNHCDCSNIIFPPPPLLHSSSSSKQKISPHISTLVCFLTLFIFLNLLLLYAFTYFCSLHKSSIMIESSPSPLLTQFMLLVRRYRGNKIETEGNFLVFNMLFTCTSIKPCLRSTKHLFLKAITKQQSNYVNAYICLQTTTFSWNSFSAKSRIISAKNSLVRFPGPSQRSFFLCLSSHFSVLHQKWIHPDILLWEVTGLENIVSKPLALHSWEGLSLPP